MRKQRSSTGQFWSTSSEDEEEKQLEKATRMESAGEDEMLWVGIQEILRGAEENGKSRKKMSGFYSRDT